MKSFRSVSFGIVCGGVCCLIIFVFGTATVRVTVFVSGLAIFFANATLLALDVNYFAVGQRYLQSIFGFVAQGCIVVSKQTFIFKASNISL